MYSAVGEKIYIGGGTNASYGFGGMQMYDGTVWVNNGELPQAAVSPVLVVYQDQLCTLGGRQPGTPFVNLASFSCWNGNGSGWHPNAPLIPARREGSAAVAKDGRLCYVGGVDDTGTNLARADCFDGGYWNPINPMKLARRGHVLLYYRDSLCAVGGAVVVGSVDTFHSSWECLASGFGSWALQSSNLTQGGRLSMGGVWLPNAFAGKGTICVAGGVFPGNVVTNSVECMNEGNTAWESKVPMKTVHVNAPMVYFKGLGCIVGGSPTWPTTQNPLMECFSHINNAWTNASGELNITRSRHGAAVYEPPTKAPTKAPTNAPTMSPTRSPVTASPTTLAPTKVPTASPTSKPTLSPSTLSPTRSPSTVSPTPAPTFDSCDALTPVKNGQGNCPVTPHLGNCTQTCPYGLAIGSELRVCLAGVWGDLVCNSEMSSSAGVTNNNFFSSFPIDSWQGIVTIIAICAVALLLVLCIFYACIRCRRKRQADQGGTIAMTVVPPYTEAGDYVFPDANSSPAEDPFAVEKRHVDPTDQAAEQQAAVEKVRQDQEAAFEQIQKSRASRDDGKHEESPGYGGISRLTVT